VSSLIHFLSGLRSVGAVLSLDGDRLKCNAPKGVITDDLRAQIAAQKQEIMAFLRDAAQRPEPGHDFKRPAERVARESPQANGELQNRAPGGGRPGEHPLSRSQRRLWFLDRMDPGKAVYNISIPMRLLGPLDRRALDEALRTVIARHECLRTHFVERDGVPWAVVESRPHWEMEFADLSALDPSDREPKVARLLEKGAQRPFRLETAPLMRVTLSRMTEREHVVQFVIHHIIFDGWSMGVIAGELTQIYPASLYGLAARLPPLQLQFRDFVRWEEEQDGQSSEKDLDYWRKQLAGDLPQLALPTDFPRPPTQSIRGDRVFADIPKELVGQLHSLAHAHNATFFMVLFAAFTVLLRRYTGQDDIVLGTPSSGRLKKEFERVIGFFVNNLVLRVDLSGDPSFAEVIRRVRKMALEAFEHQGTPFDRLVEDLQPERNLDRSPIFQVMFALQNAALPLKQFGDIELKPMEVESPYTRYDLTVDIYPHEEHFKCNFEFNTDIFEKASMRQLLNHYVHLLGAVCAGPTVPISSFALLSAEERSRQLFEWNETAHVSQAHSSVVAWVRAQALKTPDKIAVVFGTKALTYAEVDAQSNRLAQALRDRGAGPETVVGLYMQRSPQLIIGLLGIMKAGGAYLPLDPAWPSQRLEFLLNDAEVPILLTEREWDGTIPQASAKILFIDELEVHGGAMPEGTLEPGCDDLAYMIYTSGSTGTPKGTQITHGALVNLLASMLREPGLTQNDTLVAITTFSFDIAGLEIFGPLVCGATLVLASREQAMDPEKLAMLLDTTNATVLQGTPSTWRMLVESGWMGKSNLRMWCGGETLPPDLAGSLLARGKELWNLYGPTETTIWSAAHRVGGGENPVLIGRPIAQTRMYILDENGQPTPLGVPGELYIGGAGVARGYWRRPELTAARFLPDPFDAGGRMYRTGDLARYRRDGQIQLLGRTDHQIKLRGHRIELGEIEAVIESYPGIRQAVVAVTGEGTGKQLAGYIRLDPAGADTESLRSWLHERLPEYMLPAVFLKLGEIPLTPNGKVDRKRLPAPAASARESRPSAMTARNQTEQRLSKLWSDVLKVNTPGVRDNFFDLGGHSLLLLQVHSRLNREFQTNIAVVDLFRYPTIEGLASYLDRRRSTGGQAAEASIQ
jgi:amino acid adenylation domain-containing protein